MPRGPKPKEPGLCPKCNNHTEVWTRGLCRTCYVMGLRRGEVVKLVHAQPPDKLTEFQEQVLTGLMLGDGCLYKDKPHHLPYLGIRRQITDKGYQLWLAEVFQAFIKSPVKDQSVFDKRTSKTYYSSCLTTRRCAAFEPFYAKWYPEGKKIVPVDLELSPVAIAIWLADDGHVRTTCSAWRLQLKFSTMGFSPSDSDRLARMLCLRYGEYFSALVDGPGKTVNSSDAGTRALLAEVDPVWPPGMDRKTCWRDPSARFYLDVPDKKKGWSRLTTGSTCVDD